MPQSDTLPQRARRGNRRPRRRASTTISLFAVAALGAVLVATSLADNGTSKHPTTKGAHHAAPVIPANHQHLRYGATVTGHCATVDHAVTNQMVGWGVYTLDPARIPVTDARGRTLLPTSFPGARTPPGLDALASGTTRPADPTRWQVAAGSRQMPAGPAGSCQNAMTTAWPDSVRATPTSVKLNRPGPYVYWTLEHTVHWSKVATGAADPAARPCPDGAAPGATSPAPTGDPPESKSTAWHWAVASFCTKVKWWTFAVLGSPGLCRGATDGSLWPAQTYINQYAAGARLHLPLRRGEAGGNACGPSALLMAIRLSRSATGHRAAAATATPRPAALASVFDLTMEHPRAKIRSNAENEFVGEKAAAFLAHRGWSDATFGRLGATGDSIGPETTGSDQDPSNEAVLDQALKHGPVLISTDFGTARWGATGDGHMIVVLGRAHGNPGEYVVYDPAGNYFGKPAHHYDVASCGAAVLYPQSWLYAYTTGAWYIALGRPTA